MEDLCPAQSLVVRFVVAQVIAPGVAVVLPAV